jgi:hypothetical protein
MTHSRASQADASRYMAGIGTILLFGFVAFSPSVLTAQSPAPADSPVQVGDRWTYDQRDEITGLPTVTFTHTVTEVSPAEFVMRVTTQGKTGSSIRIYDHDWNLIDRGNFKTSQIMEGASSRPLWWAKNGGPSTRPGALNQVTWRRPRSPPR